MNQKFDIVFRCTCCVYMQLIKTLCQEKIKIIRIFFYLSLFSVYGHGAWFYDHPHEVKEVTQTMGFCKAF